MNRKKMRLVSIILMLVLVISTMACGKKEEAVSADTAVTDVPSDTVVDTNEPSTEEPTEQVPEEPSTEEPTEPAPTEPSTEEPTEPAPEEPSIEEPTEPAPEEPSVEKPTEPAPIEPSIEEPGIDVSKYSGMRNITTMELVDEMGIGINLGNTFESFGDWIEQWGAGGFPSGTVQAYETAWGSPVITKEIIQGYANEGFDSLRIPVHWMNLMSADYTLSAEYIAEVKKVVEWALEAELYVIINIHHDEDGFFANFATDKDNCMKAYIRVWEQIAEAFRDYDDHLIFEALNEEGGWDSIWNRWGGTTGKEQAFGILNDINQSFVNTVRASGGNNEVRHLLISGYYTDIEATCDAYFKMPEDPAKRCAVSVHYYTPAGFAILEDDADWGKARSTWGTDADFAELIRLLDMMETTYIKNGIPVIIGEYGCPVKNKEIESVRLFLTSVCEEALKRDMCPILWDVTDAQYNRTTCQMIDQELKRMYNDISAKY